MERTSPAVPSDPQQETINGLVLLLQVLLDTVGGCLPRPRELARVDDPAAVPRIVRGLLEDARAIQSDILRTRERVRDLEGELERMSALVRRDPLTGALNRRGLEEAFAAEAARCARGAAAPAAALVDLDNFKAINDRFGHAAGDRVLVHLVARLHETLRPTDVVGRVGGEEFAVLLPATSLPGAAAVLRRVQRALGQHPLLHEGARLPLTFSAGVALRREGEGWQALLERADRALYRAKRQGKNRVVCADADERAAA